MSAERKQAAKEMAANGESQRDIAKALGVSVGQINADLRSETEQRDNEYSTA
jgi:hypothetical protein